MKFNPRVFDPEHYPVWWRVVDLMRDGEQRSFHQIRRETFAATATLTNALELLCEAGILFRSGKPRSPGQNVDKGYKYRVIVALKRQQRRVI